METIDDMEVQILLSKSDSFNSGYLKDVVSSKRETKRIIHILLKKIHSFVLVSRITCEWCKYIRTFESFIRKNSM